MSKDAEQDTLQEIADHLHDISVILERLLSVQRNQGSSRLSFASPSPLNLRRREPVEQGSDTEEVS